MKSARPRRAWLVALWLGAAAGIGCSEDTSTQVMTGSIGASDAIAVRAVSGDRVVTAAAIRSDGSFTLALPAGNRYRLEVLTSGGVRHVLSRHGGLVEALAFEVCAPVDPFDMGTVAENNQTECDGPNCMPCGDPPPCTDPMDPNCPPPPPPPCMDPDDPNCKPCEPGDPNCDPCPMGQCPPPPPPCMDPLPDGTCPDPCTTDPNRPECKPCMPGDPNCDPCPMGQCPPPPCMDPSDPNCGCMPDGSCPPPCTDPMDPSCNCYPGDPNCEPPPPCMDPTDPETCQDPCTGMEDPSGCGCTNDDPNCWPQPEDPMCDPNGTCASDKPMSPDHAPIDFGCKESSAS